LKRLFTRPAVEEGIVLSCRSSPIVISMGAASYRPPTGISYPFLEMRMLLRRTSLRTRILLMLGALMAITVAVGVMSIGYTYMIDGFFTTLVEKDVEALVSAQELENSLIMQKGYTTYYFTDGDPQWLKELRKYHELFEFWLKQTRQHVEVEKERTILNEIEAQYIRYALARDEVLDYYKKGEKGAGLELHKKARVQLFKMIDLCDEFEQANKARITEARHAMTQRVRIVNLITVLCVVGALMVGVFLASVLLNDVLGPIRQLAVQTYGSSKDKVGVDEVQALSNRVQHLMVDVDQTRSKLKWSREHLQQAEKWALVGKLAAGVAHSVRNPLTSVKMRLFSMERTLALSPSQKEDFEVIAEEIRHIDTIVGNFLEFSRPPKLKMQKISLSDCVDMALQLLRHRLESYSVAVLVKRERRLPEIPVDPDQVKEVLVNLIVNSCEAMVDGGSITIKEEEGFSDRMGPVSVIMVSDNGPGIPEGIQGKLFQPFYSTKEEGTGLGLSIALRIIEDHGGSLDLESKPGEGATFIITLPAKEVPDWEQSL
jgi:signal transduction histidine kinase